MYCKKCGFNLKDDVTICPFCNTDQTKEIDTKVRTIKIAETPKYEMPQKVEEKPTYQPYVPYGRNENTEEIKMNSLGYMDLNTKFWHHILVAAGGYIALYVLLYIFQILLVKIFKYDSTAANAMEIENLILGISETLSEIGVVVITAIVFKKFIKKFFANFKNVQTWKWYGICFAGMYISNLIYAQILQLFNWNSTSTNQDLVNDIVKNYPLLGFFFVVVAAPLFEEIIFRFGFFRMFTVKGKKIIEVLGLVLTTLLFAGVHLIATIQSVFETATPNWSVLLNDLPTLPAYLIGAFFITFGYYKSKNLNTGMLMHMSWNFLSFLSIILTTNEEVSSAIQFFFHLF